MMTVAFGIAPLRIPAVARRDARRSVLVTRSFGRYLVHDDDRSKPYALARERGERRRFASVRSSKRRRSI
jgi:hypothetical protein